MRKHRKVKVGIIIVLCVLGFCFLFFRYRRIDDSILKNADNTRMVVGVGEEMPGYFVTDTGILYAKNHNIRFYDVEKKQEYVLCDKLNCTHLTKDCSAFYNDADAMNGLALYHGSIYYFDKNEKKNCYELYRMNTVGNEKKVVAELEIGEIKNNKWFMSGVQEVYYCGETVWFSVNYYYMDEKGNASSCVQWLGADLKNGKITEITQKRLEEINVQLVGVTEEYLVFQKNRMSETEERESYEAYEIGTGTMKVMEDNPTVMNCDREGNVIGTLSKYIFLGEYEDGFLCYEPDWNVGKQGNTVYFVWNPQTNEKEEIYTLEKGTSISFGEGNVYDCIFEENKMLCLQYKENNKADIGLLDLETKEYKALFEDTDNVTFRLVGKTENAFVGKIYNLEENNSGYKIYSVNQEDYYAGSFDNKNLIQEQKNIWN